MHFVCILKLQLTTQNSLDATATQRDLWYTPHLGYPQLQMFTTTTSTRQNSSTHSDSSSRSPSHHITPTTGQLDALRLVKPIAVSPHYTNNRATLVGTSAHCWTAFVCSALNLSIINSGYTQQILRDRIVNWNFTVMSDSIRFKNKIHSAILKHNYLNIKHPLI